LLAGKSGIGPITQFDSSDLKVHIAAEVKDFDPAALFGRRLARRTDRFTQFALESAKQAVADAGLVFDADGRLDTGVVIGTAIGGLLTVLDNYDTLNTSGPNRVSPLAAPMMMPNAASAVVALEYGLIGPNFSVASACATGSHAVGEAAKIIRSGQANTVICGGAEAVSCQFTIAAFGNMGALSSRNDDPEHASRPFDVDRDGFVMGEGAGVLVLESLEHAMARGARIYAEFAGYGASADAFHITAPDESGAGAAAAMSMALKDAGLEPDEIDYINAHGTSTELNDPIETRAIHTVFGSHADSLAVSSTKSMIGHLMGAAGAVEAVVCAKSIETGWVHPTANHENPDPECDLDYVSDGARELNPRAVLSNSFGFGGHNGTIAFRSYEPPG
jgi:3-oxoacyl-[acyl-carrier-protein] synthase II